MQQLSLSYDFHFSEFSIFDANTFAGKGFAG